MPEERDDAELVRRVGDGDTDSLRTLYERYGNILFGMALRIVGDRNGAEECVQDAFVAVWRNARTYDPERARVSTWVIAIVRNRAVDLVRARAARPVESRAEIMLGDESPDAADVAAAAETSRRVAGALAELPSEQREVVTLAYFHGLSHSEIADRLELPLGTVKGRIRLALEHLRVLVHTYALDAEQRA